VTLHIVDVRLTCLINITYLLTYLLTYTALLHRSNVNVNDDVDLCSAPIAKLTPRMRSMCWVLFKEEQSGICRGKGRGTCPGHWILTYDTKRPLDLVRLTDFTYKYHHEEVI